MLDTSERIGIFIVDDHLVVRRGLAAIIAGEPDLEIVGEAANGEEALRLLKGTCPDVVLMDLQMPEMDGLEATRRVKALCPRSTVIVVTVSDAEALLVDAIRAGASGYLLKDLAPQLLLQSIRAVTSGGTLVSSDLLRRALEGGGDRRAPMPAALLERPLSPREKEILLMLGQGLRYQDIADRLCVALVTVKKHMSNLMGKLEVSDRAQAVLRAVNLGLIPNPESRSG